MRPLAFFSFISSPFRWLFFALFIGLVGIIGCNRLGNASSELPDSLTFNQHIRPILSQNCYLCHGPDSSSRKADLRLDLREMAIAVREDGTAAIVPGDPAASSLLSRITHADPEERMPPPEAKKLLSEREIALLREWIRQGADWQEHWAFVPPQTSRKSRSIDHYLNRAIELQQLEATPPAEPATLVRRLSYLLTGLPPEPETVAAFVADPSESAYQKLVEDHLDSPHFGERWARHWMDLTRYSETKGHEFDYPIGGAWRYRDYLIRAFNADLPYDQLVREHLAGDLLPTPRLNPLDGTPESPIGTAYFAFAEGKHSPVDLVVDEAERIDNLIDVTTKTFQALTVGCARCHDHKFDPIPTTDYYALYGIFKSTRFHPIPAGQTEGIRNAIERMSQLQQETRTELAAQWQTKLPLAQTVSDEKDSSPTAVSSSADWQLLGDFRQMDWGEWSSDGLAFGRHPFSGGLELNADSSSIQGVSYPRASSRWLGPGIQGALRSPTFVLEKDTIVVRAAGEFSTLRVVIDNFQLIQDPIYGELELLATEGDWKTYKFPLRPWLGHKAYLEFIPGQYLGDKRPRHLYNIPRQAWLEVEYAIAYDSLPPAEWFQPASQSSLPIALQHWQVGKANWGDIHRLNQALKKGELSRALGSWETIFQERQQLQASMYDSTHVEGVTEGDAIFSPVFLRGSEKTLSKEVVPHRFFSALGGEEKPFEGNGSGRLALANAIADPANPLTARVMVNRVWHHLFGRGLVETVDNFGIQGKSPTHPELLDALAVQFVAEGWSVKQLIRQIVLSEAFRRSTEVSEASQARDPQNLWLSRFPLQRLEAEAIRDGILSVSGSLDDTQFGPPVPVHLTEFMEGRGRPRESGPLDGAGRRSVYLAIRRNFLVPMMLVFDQPVPFSTFGRRNVSNVPAQSLTLMNDPFVIEQAGIWASRVLAEATTAEARIETMYQAAFSRSPSPEESAQALAFLQEQAAQYDCQGEAALEELQPWQDYAHALFNSKEFIFLK